MIAPNVSLIHCNKSKHRRWLRLLAHEMELRICTPDYDPHGILIQGKNSEKFLSLFENNPDMDIFYAPEMKHPRSLAGAFRSCCRHTCTLASETIDPKATSAATPSQALVAYGRSAPWYADYYNFPSSEASPTIAVISMGGSYQLSDLQYYWQTVCGLSVYPTVINVSIGQSLPPFTGQGPDLENTLDLEIVGAVCPHSTLLFISVPNSVFGLYQAFSTAINGTTVGGVKYQPTIITCSWGTPEASFGTSNLGSLHNLFGQGVSKGIVITVAAGDNGATDGYTSNGLPNVDFPASSPWVIAVGGTTVTSSSETVWSWNATNKWGTGSGCSTYFGLPSWQDGLVTLPTGTTPSVSYLQGKRAVPDVALSADPSHGYTIYLNGKLYITQIGGTSCATPLMAGFIGRMNLKYSQAVVYYLYQIFRNPSAYPNCYKDITVGTNDNLPNSSNVWTAGPNFDLCSGMGSINGNNIYQALQKLVSSS